MKTMDMQYSFYHMYDRLGEDVYYNYTIEYDWNSILKNDFTKDNFKIVLGGISPYHDGFFSQYSIDKLQWEKKMSEYLLSSKNDTSLEAFLEELSPEEIQEYDGNWS